MPARSRTSMDQDELEREDKLDASKLDDSEDRRKSQAQRLLEFEMWRNGNTLKDLEYSQRRTEKKQRRKELKKHYDKRCWKKVYLPAVLSMVLGTFLTFCATLQTLAADTFFWDIRGVLVILGPILIGAGFLALMLAAGCTFRHDQEARQRCLNPPPQFLYRESSQFDFQNRRLRPAAASVRSDSVATSDLPVPDDLDPSKNFLRARPDWPRPGKGTRRTRSVGRELSTKSGGPLMGLDNSYSSTATWVQFVSSAYGQHPQQPTLARQSSDSHLMSSTPSSHQHAQDARRSLKEQRDSRSQSDLHADRALSLTSSGYQSASDCASGAAECQTFCECGRRKGNELFPHSAALRPQTARHPTNHVSTKYPSAGSKGVRGNQSKDEILPGSRDAGAQRICPELSVHAHKQSLHHKNIPISCL